MTNTTTALTLLRDTEHYLSALHGTVARHDNLAANLACAGCELRDRITAALPGLTAPEPPADRAAVLREAIDVADRLSMEIEQAMKTREIGPLTALQDLADELRRMADETATETPPADPWSISYHQLSPARNNPAVCTCGLGPTALMHNEPPHPFNGRPKPGMPPVTGICTDCHHHETAACHQPADGGRQDDTVHSCPGRWGGPDCRCFDNEPAAGARQDGAES